MTSSPTFQLLCCELVEDCYGDFYRTIFECLTHGRFNAQQVAQKCHLPLRQARAGLSGLIQLRLIHYHTPRDALPIYSANLAQAYNIVRTGQLIEAARTQYGETAGLVITTICELGFSTVGELRDRTFAARDRDSQSMRDISSAIDQLLDMHFLIHLRKAHFGEPHDVQREEELKLLSPTAIAKLTGSKAKAEHAMNVGHAYDRVVNTSNSETGHVNPDFHLAGSASNGHTTNGVNGVLPDLALLVQPNFYKVVEISQQLIVGEHARKMHGRKASVIIQNAIGQASAPDIWSKGQHAGHHDLHTYKLLDSANAQWRREEASNSIRVNGTANGHHDSYTEITRDDIEDELLYMTEGPFRFLENMGSSIYSIDKESLNQWTQKEELLRVMDSRLDPPAPRILRILIDKGKLEEKTLQEIGLLGAKELRQNLSLLKQMGYLDLQEVPRNPTRLPNQTVFLWSYEQDRVASLVLEQIYTTMLRLLQMLRNERASITNTLTKLEREDVKGREEEALPPGEFAVLSRFRKAETWAWAEIQRLDSTIAILKDA